MQLACSLQLHDVGQLSKGSQAQQQQLDLDLAKLFPGKASTFEDLDVYLKDDLGLHAPSFSTCVQPVVGPLLLYSYQDGYSSERRFYLTSDGSIYKAARSSGYVPDSSTMLQPYAECTAAVTSATAGHGSGAWCTGPILKASALTTQPQPFQIFVKDCTGKTVTLVVHEGTTIRQLKMMMLERQGPLPEEQRIRYSQQRIIQNGAQWEDPQTLGDIARIRKVTMNDPKKGLHEATFHQVLTLRGGMYHVTSGRRDNGSLSDSAPNLAQVTVLAYTGAEVQLSVPMADSPGGEHFGAEDLAGLAKKALNEQAL